MILSSCFQIIETPAPATPWEQITFCLWLSAQSPLQKQQWCPSIRMKIRRQSVTLLKTSEIKLCNAQGRDIRMLSAQQQCVSLCFKPNTWPGMARRLELPKLIFICNGSDLPVTLGNWFIMFTPLWNEARVENEWWELFSYNPDLAILLGELN